MSFENLQKPRKTRSDSKWEKVEPVVRKYAGKRTREVIAESIGMSATHLSVMCSKHNISLKVPGRHGGPSKRTVSRKNERAKHEALDAPVKLGIDVEQLWRPIKTNLPIKVRQHYYA